MFYAEKMAEWLVNLNYDNIPKDVVKKTKECIYDWVSITIYGAESPWSNSLLNTVRETGGNEESTILVHKDRTSCANAAMMNSMMALSYDLSDTYPKVELHPSCSLIASALAVAERENSTGKDLITSVVAGYEIITRVAASMNKRPQSFTAARGFEANSIFPPFGAVSAAGKLLKLDKEQMTNAIGLAGGSMGAATIDYLVDGNWTYRWNSARAAHNGILNAIMAKNGYVGPHAVFEGQWDNKGRFGVINALAGDMTFKDDLIDGLGEIWNIKDMAFKFYGCCHYNQGYSDGIIKLMNEHNFNADDVEEVTAYLPHFALFLGVPREVKIKPKNLTISQWSLPFVLATVLTDGHLMNPKEQLSDKKLTDPQILQLTDRVKIERDRNLDKAFIEEARFDSPVKIKLNNGKEYEITSTCKGFSFNPLTEEEMDIKFNTLTSSVFNEEKREKIKKEIKNLEEITSISDMINNW
ncbi:MAG: MmgE/PrpD family protein [Spirochaetota bacterium]|nr:MmgE/PrpD family protein [Spirochaetota bacterium]